MAAPDPRHDDASSSLAAGPTGRRDRRPRARRAPLPWPASPRRSSWRSTSASTSSSTCRGEPCSERHCRRGRRPHRSEAVAVAAERRWAIVVGVIIAAARADDGRHRPALGRDAAVARGDHRREDAARLGRVRREQPRHDARRRRQGHGAADRAAVFVRAAVHRRAGRHAGDVPRHGTDAIHGFVVGTTNANTMLIPGFVATFTTTFQKAGRAADAVPRILRHRPRGDVGARAGAAAARSSSRRRAAEKG